MGVVGVAGAERGTPCSDPGDARRNMAGGISQPIVLNGTGR